MLHLSSYILFSDDAMFLSVSTLGVRRSRTIVQVLDHDKAQDRERDRHIVVWLRAAHLTCLGRLRFLRDGGQCGTSHVRCNFSSAVLSPRTK